jgi:hypothetical protein
MEDIIAGVIAGVVIVGILTIRIMLTAKSRRKPTGPELEPGETRIADAYGKSRDIRIKGFTLSASSAYEGVLVLTDRRLLYSKYNGKKIVLSLEPGDVLKIEIGQTGLIFKTPTIVVTYHDKKKNKEKIVNWAIPAIISVGMMPFPKTYNNPHTAESFAKLLQEWKD